MKTAAQQLCSNSTARRWFAPVIITLLLSACSSPMPLSDSDEPAKTARGSKAEARRASAPDAYVVAKGDTLHAIAFRYGMDYRQLASLNGIKKPYTIYPGQRIRFSRGVTGTSPNKSAVVSSTKSNSAVTRSASAEHSPSIASNLPWQWPVAGKILRRYDSEGGTNKGIDIAAAEGSQVLAAAGGTVVYAGNGLRAYGNLLIIKHNDEFLSAYGYNRRLLVTEAEEVKVGQPIAEIGGDGQITGLLHFEIRRQGKPIDPLSFLPRQR